MISKCSADKKNNIVSTKTECLDIYAEGLDKKTVYIRLRFGVSRAGAESEFMGSEIISTLAAGADSFVICQLSQSRKKFMNKMRKISKSSQKFKNHRIPEPSMVNRQNPMFWDHTSVHGNPDFFKNLRNTYENIFSSLKSLNDVG